MDWADGQAWKDGNSTEEKQEMLKRYWYSVFLLTFIAFVQVAKEFPKWLSSKKICLQCRRQGSNPWVRKMPWKRKWQPTPVFSPGEFHGQRSLVGFSPWGHRARHNLATEHIHTHTHTHTHTEACKAIFRAWSYLFLSSSIQSNKEAGMDCLIPTLYMMKLRFREGLGDRYKTY